ncbi:alpha/beta-hydrolase [Pseudovirgaria hyperparasitica]|uniref:Alpha/beta-hydrolase n=1 Tax=Pseudovirgaria hyperparasitica TaxID=470096 RepID=A0A6A6WEM5_9PEZI|nr:alpha/beta-hydrolase [Pseudovirgaria hyperparasitica]KAF2761278.1 alpha/beta-hydrolase [Pseudovirgaria hyperparasitica]
MQSATATPPELYHVSLNPSRPSTIIFIHGLGSMHAEWKDVTPHLTAYHILIPDINGHGKSSHISPYTIPAAADAVARLIRTHAHGSTAHVVGLSMGGFITLDLTRRYPELVQSAFISGAAPPEGPRRFFFARPRITWALDALQLALPEAVYRWSARKQGLLPHEELYAHAQANRRWEVWRDVFLSICDDVTWDDVRAVRVRTLLVAGGKMDDVAGIRRVGRALREAGAGESGAYVVEKAGHAWDLQFPDLFAQAVGSWIEGRMLPEEFEAL